MEATATTAPSPHVLVTISPTPAQAETLVHALERRLVHSRADDDLP